MLGKLTEMIFGTEERPAEDPAARLRMATCVVLVEAARSDDEFTLDERSHIAHVLTTRFALERHEADALIEEATEVGEASNDLFQFTRALNEGFANDEKIAIMREVWRLIYSDGTLTGHEDHLAHKLRTLLNLNHPQMIEAKMAVLDEIREKDNGGL